MNIPVRGRKCLKPRLLTQIKHGERLVVTRLFNLSIYLPCLYKLFIKQDNFITLVGMPICDKKFGE